MASLAPTAIMHVSWVEFTSRRGERQGGSVATQLPSSQIQMLRPVHKSACVNRVLLLLPVNLVSFGTRINAGDTFKWKSGVDNKRHTCAHQPLTSPWPMEAKIPPSPPFTGSINPRRFDLPRSIGPLPFEIRTLENRCRRCKWRSSSSLRASLAHS